MRTTRWQGIATASGLAPHACATARTALGAPIRLGNLQVARRLASRHGTQRLPYALLEGRAADVQRKIQPQGRRFHEAHHARHQLLEVAISADEGGARKAILHVAHQWLGSVAQQNGAYAARGGRYQNRPERAFPHGEANLRMRAALAEVRGRHSQNLRRCFVEAPAGIEPGAVDGFGDGAAAAEFLAHPPCPVRRGIGARSDSGDGPEDTMKVETAHARRGGEPVQPRRFFGFFNQPAGLGHQGGLLFRQRRLIGPAALAGTEARRAQLPRR